MSSSRTHQVITRGGTTVTYRHNRGDIQGVREVWLDETYRLPPESSPVSIVDLGANIGLTSLWLAERYPGCRIVAVEPVPENADLLRRNLAGNGVDSTVVEAAVGAAPGVAAFAASNSSNFGKLDPGGSIEVEVVDMSTVLELAGGHADLVKLDIEGGEEALLLGDRGWMADVDVLVVEFHPDVVDYAHLTQLIQQEGFRYHPAGTLVAVDYFQRSS